MNLYLDASVIVPTLVQEPTTSVALGFLAAATDELTVSDYGAAEVASAISKLLRIGRLTRDAATRRLHRFDAWRQADTTTVEIDHLDILGAEALVRRFELKLRAPDALHLATCLRLGARMVTFDGTLAAAAEACGATTVRP